MNHANTFRPHRRRGQAMIEFIMAIPLLAVVIALIFFFGWSMKHQQQVFVADRYAGWRGVTRGDWIGAAALNDNSLAAEAAPVSIEYPQGPSETVTELADALAQASAQAGPMVDDLFIDRAPRNNWAQLDATFPTEVGLWSWFPGGIEHAFIREGRQWQRGQLAYEVSDNGRNASLIADHFFATLDAALQGVNPPGDTVGDTFRNLYISRW